MSEVILNEAITRIINSPTIFSEALQYATSLGLISVSVQVSLIIKGENSGGEEILSLDELLSINALKQLEFSTNPASQSS
jgi:Co/Zn/Cd efflux system component